MGSAYKCSRALKGELQDTHTGDLLLMAWDHLHFGLPFFCAYLSTLQYICLGIGLVGLWTEDPPTLLPVLLAEPGKCLFQN